jgi:hypothetical protein
MARSNAPRFKLSARETRGGWRGVATLGGGVVALKTMPVFREKADALAAIRAWVAKHGAHADRLINPKNPKVTTRQSREESYDRLRRFLMERGATPAQATKEIRKFQSRSWASKEITAMHASRRIAYRERKLIPKKFFALPERAPGRGALPLADPKKGWRYDPAHVRNAAARLAQMHKRGTVSPSEYHFALRRIIAAACECGVERTCRRHLGIETRGRVIPITRATTRAAAYSRPHRNSRGRFTR